MLFYVLLVALFLSAAGGVWGQSSYGYAGWSPVGVVIVVMVVLYLTGRLRST